MRRRFRRGPGRRRKEGWILIMLVTTKKLVLALLDWLDFGSAKGVITLLWIFLDVLNWFISSANGRDVDNCKTTH